MLRAVLFILVAGACSEDAKPNPQSKSIQKSLQGGGGKVEMKVDADGPKPVGLDALKKRFPSWSEMPEKALTSAGSAVNLVPGPCVDCGDLPLAHCAIEHPQGCPVIAKIARRAQRLAERGMPTDELKVAINYPDLWFPELGEGLPVTVHLYRDAEGPFASKTREAQSVLTERFGAQLNWVVHEADVPPPEALGVRSRPTWFINGHRFRGAQSGRTLGRFINFELLDGTQ